MVDLWQNLPGPEEVGHTWLNFTNYNGWVTLIDFSYLSRLALSTFTEVAGPQFSNQDSRPGPVIEKAKRAFYLAISKIN